MIVRSVRSGWKRRPGADLSVGVFSRLGGVPSRRNNGAIHPSPALPALAPFSSYCTASTTSHRLTSLGGRSQPPFDVRPVATIRARHMATKKKGSGASADEIEMMMSEGVAAQMKKCVAALRVLFEPVEIREKPQKEFVEELTEDYLNYFKETQQQSISFKEDLQLKLYLKQEAQDALPEQYAEATRTQLSIEAPLCRTPATVTPPIKGYLEESGDEDMLSR